MRATDCDRYGFTLNGTRHTYGDLRHYVCNECGGAMMHLMPWNAEEERNEDRVGCAACGCEEMISERRYLEQETDGWEVMRGLPEHLRALMQGGQPRCLSATEAIADLFG